jgi:hypothetical protein
VLQRRRREDARGKIQLSKHETVGIVQNILRFAVKFIIEFHFLKEEPIDK